MCGNELPASAYAHRFGALAILSPAVSPSSSPGSSPMFTCTQQLGPVSGSVAFFNAADHACQVATHVCFSLSGVVPASRFLLSIENLSSITLDASGQNQPVRLQQPLHLHVGDDADRNRGIIGHKIAIYCGLQADQAVMEGIVGFNSLPQSPVL